MPPVDVHRRARPAAASGRLTATDLRVYGALCVARLPASARCPVVPIELFTPAGIAWDDALLRVGLSIVLALTIGVERFLRRKPVDFRPFVIISLASCGLVLGLLELGARTQLAGLSIDPGKVISGIMSGIGFLGAGALFREKHVVQGAGSAAAIWAAGAIGILCGIGVLWLAGLVAIGIVVLFVAASGLTDRYQVDLDPSDHP